MRGWGSLERLDPILGYYLPLDHQRDRNKKAHLANIHLLQRLQASSGWDLIDADGYTQHPTPYTLNPTPYTLDPEPYTLHPEPYILHPTP